MLFLGHADATIAFPPTGCDPAGAAARAAAAGAWRSAAGHWRRTTSWPASSSASGSRTAGSRTGWGSNPDRRTTARRPTGAATAKRASPILGAHRAALRESVVHHFVVRDGGALVGHAVLNVAGTTAGVYDMGVGLEHRRRGHGLALTRAAVARAGQLGCSSVTLNATGDGEPMYRRAGFASLGLGMTWWMFPGAARLEVGAHRAYTDWRAPDRERQTLSGTTSQFLYHSDRRLIWGIPPAGADHGVRGLCSLSRPPAGGA